MDIYTKGRQNYSIVAIIKTDTHTQTKGALTAAAAAAAEHFLSAAVSDVALIPSVDGLLLYLAEHSPVLSLHLVNIRSINTIFLIYQYHAC
jgi:hypothetical protein